VPRHDPVTAVLIGPGDRRRSLLLGRQRTCSRRGGGGASVGAAGRALAGDLSDGGNGACPHRCGGRAERRTRDRVDEDVCESVVVQLEDLWRHLLAASVTLAPLDVYLDAYSREPLFGWRCGHRDADVARTGTADQAWIRLLSALVGRPLGASLSALATSAISRAWASILARPWPAQPCTP